MKLTKEWAKFRLEEEFREFSEIALGQIKNAAFDVQAQLKDVKWDQYKTTYYAKSTGIKRRNAFRVLEDGTLDPPPDQWIYFNGPRSHWGLVVSAKVHYTDVDGIGYFCNIKKHVNRQLFFKPI